MAQVRWTPQAADDLDAITEFIAQGSPAYAVLFVISGKRNAVSVRGSSLTA